MTRATRQAEAPTGVRAPDRGEALSSGADAPDGCAPKAAPEDPEACATTVNPGSSAPSKEHADDAEDRGYGKADFGELPDADGMPLAVRDLPELAREDREKDRDLVRRAQGGDRDAFRHLYERHHKRAYAVALGVLKNKQDALDVVQESFVKVHRHLDSFQGSSSFYTWLYRIVMNLAIDQLRRRKSARSVEYDDAQGREGEVADDTILPRMLDANPRKAVFRRELMEWVQRALETLPDYHRQVILLREVEGLSYEEMAEVLGVPKGTIMSRLFHARRKMQAALKGYVEGGDLNIEE